MSRSINYIGKRFGRLTVIERAEDHITNGGVKRAQYLCVCDCGNKVVVQADKLRSGHTKSCGCILRELCKQTIKKAAEVGIKNKEKRRSSLVGKKFGKLTVIENSGKDKNGLYYSICVCECGEVSTVCNNNLKRGISTQCKKCQLKELRENFQKTECVEGTALCKLTQKTRSDNSTGVKGVWFEKRSGKFVAEIRLSGKKYYFGKYSDLEDARKAREMAEEIMFSPVLERHGRPTIEEVREKLIKKD